MSWINPPNVEIRLYENEHINCDVCHTLISDDDAIIHVHTAREYGGGGTGLKITHTGCADKVEVEK